MALIYAVPRSLSKRLEDFLKIRGRHVNLQLFQQKGTTESIHKPDISPTLSPTPALIPTIPIWPRGFWSNHSFTNSRVYSRLRSNLVGRISRSIIEFERSMMMMRWRMIVRRIALDGASNLVVGRVRWRRINDCHGETIGIVPFATSAGYEIVYCSLETSRLIFLDCIPRPDVGCLPCIGSLKLFR